MVPYTIFLFFGNVLVSMVPFPSIYNIWTYFGENMDTTPQHLLFIIPSTDLGP